MSRTAVSEKCTGQKCLKKYGMNAAGKCSQAATTTCTCTVLAQQTPEASALLVAPVNKAGGGAAGGGVAQSVDDFMKEIQNM